MHNDAPKDYSTDKVNYLNVYDPVKYMLKNQQRRTTNLINEKVAKNEKEGGTLIRNGYLLEKVEGDHFYDCLLFYDDKGLLNHFLSIHKLTGRTEQWTLHFAPNGYLLRYDYELVNEGLEETIEEDLDFEL